MNTEQIKELIQNVSNSTLTHFEYAEDNVRLVMKKKIQKSNLTEKNFMAAVYEQDQSSAISSNSSEIEGTLITSPLVGTFYVAPGEDMPPFVQNGDYVNKGQTVAIVEAMKLMNEIECECAGIIQEIFVQNGESVEYGQPLFRVIPS